MPARQRATIYDVAAQAGVSISTVSLALNKPSRVAETTRARIFDAVASLEYRPKAEASLQARRGLGRIAVVAPFSAHASFYRRLNGIMSASENEDVDVIVYDHPSIDTMTSPLLTSLPVRGSIDGLIAMGIPLDRGQFPAGDAVPIVVVDYEHEHFDSVTVGDAEGGRMAGTHLLDVGSLDFCFIGEPQASEYQSPRAARLQGFRKALNQAGHTLSKDNVITVSAADQCQAMEAIGQTVARLQKPGAILAYTDRLAAIAYRTCRQLGLSVPDEIKIVGFDDSELALALDLTSVQVPFFDSGRHAFEIMARRLSEPDQPAQYTRLGQQVVVRQSSAASDGDSPVVP